MRVYIYIYICITLKCFEQISLTTTSYKLSQLSLFKALLRDLLKKLLHTIPSSNYSKYPLVVKHGWQENPPFSFMSFALKPPCLIGISQPAVFDDAEG